MNRVLGGFFALLLVLAGCATRDENFVAGRSLIDAGRQEEGLALVEKAAQAAPGNAEYRAYLVNQRFALGARRTAEAEVALESGDFDSAERLYRAALAADTGNTRAATGLARLQIERDNRRLLADAETEIKGGRLAGAEAIVRRVLDADPRQRKAHQLLARIAAARLEAGRAADAGGGALARLVTLEFRDTTLKALFDGLARTTGINFVFDKDVRTDTRVTFFVRDTRLDDVIRMVMATNQLERKLLNDSSMLIYPNTPAKQKDYQELSVRSFYLGNADVKQTLNMIRTVLKTRDLFVDEKLNLLIMRDTPEAILLAEKLVAAQDLPEPEVLLELEVLEVKRGKLQELGIQWPTTLTALNLVPAPTTTTSTGGVVIQNTNSTTTTSQLTVQTLRNLTSAGIGVSPNPAITAHTDTSDVNLLANPRIRVRNREKARVHIGDRVPVITTTSTANVGVSESVNYLEVGLRLEVEPNVHLDDEVAIKLGLEVSSIVREVRGTQGSLTYQVGTRNTATALRVKDGETQILAGLISDEERRGASKVPGLGDLPLVGRLFGVWREDQTKSEIVLLVTPRIVRNLVAAPGYEAQFRAGTEAAVGASSLAISPRGRLALASAGRSGAQAAAASQSTPPAPGPQAAPQPRLEWQGAASAPLGGELQVRLALADAPAGAGARLDLVFDPQIFSADGASAPGRVPLALQGGAAQLSLRVIAKQPASTQLRVENAVVDAPSGERTALPAFEPRQISVGAP